MRFFLLFLTFFFPFQFALNLSAGIDLSIARLLIILAFLIWLISSLVRKKLYFDNNFISWGLISFLLVAFLSFIKAEEIGWALRKLMVFLSIFPLYFLIISYFKKEDFLKISRLILSSATIVSFLGIFQFVSQFIWGTEAVFKFWAKYLARFFLGASFSEAVIQNPSWWVNIGGETYLRATALFPDPHMLGFFLGMSLPLFIPLILNVKKNKSSRSFGSLGLYGLMAFINLAALGLTFSRGAYLGSIISGIVGLALLTPQLTKKIRAILLISATLIVILLLLITPLRNRFLSSFDLTEGSVAGRLQIWQDSLDVWQNNFWLGVGIGNYSYYLNPLNPYRAPVYAHNTYLDIGVEMGVFALLLWLAIFGYAILKLLKIIKEKETGFKTKLINIALISSLSYFLVHSFFETPLYSPRVLPYLMIILALVSLSLKEKGHLFKQDS